MTEWATGIPVTVGGSGGRQGGELCALSWDNCYLAQGWGGDHPGHQVGEKHQCVHESTIPPGLSICKKTWGDFAEKQLQRSKGIMLESLHLWREHDLKSDNLEIEMSHLVSIND